MGFELWVYFAIGVLGLVAGTLGGMLGVGGSLIMIPALVMMFGREGQTEGFNLHLYQAAAMIVNLFVAIPATLRHRQAGAVMGAVMKAHKGDVDGNLARQIAQELLSEGS